MMYHPQWSTIPVSIMSISVASNQEFTVTFNNTIMITILVTFKCPTLLEMLRNVVKKTSEKFRESPGNITLMVRSLARTFFQRFFEHLKLFEGAFKTSGQSSLTDLVSYGTIKIQQLKVNCK